MDKDVLTSDECIAFAGLDMNHLFSEVLKKKSEKKLQKSEIKLSYIFYY